MPAPVRRTLVGAALLAAALLAAVAVCVPQALANKEISAPTLPDGSTMTVSDDITRIHVDKIDERTHDAVKGARMQILVRDTGEVVDEWVTDGTTHEFEKGLDVNVVYVLREVEAPEGYEKIADVEFFANEMEGTGITLLTEREDVVLTDAYKVALYEPHEAAVAVTERTEYRRGLVATGDVLPVAALAACACAALAVVVFAAVRRKRSRDGKGE